MNELCIYHGSCTDGIAAAWVAWTANPDQIFYPGVYQKAPPWEIIDNVDHVLLVDFSYKRPVLEQIVDRVRSVTVLDHHKTAQADLESLLTEDKIQGSFNMDLCGALITWYWFFPDQNPPQLLKEIDAYDRWLDTKDQILITGLKSYPHTPEDSSKEAWEKLMRLWAAHMNAADSCSELYEEGRHIHRYYRQRVDETKEHARLVRLVDLDIPTVNAPYYLVSDVAGELAEESDGVKAGMVWWQNNDGSVTFRLRSHGAFDVSKIAMVFGGGGHKNAAGFKLPSEKAKLILFSTTSFGAN